MNDEGHQEHGDDPCAEIAVALESLEGMGDGQLGEKVGESRRVERAEKIEREEAKPLRPIR